MMMNRHQIRSSLWFSVIDFHNILLRKLIDFFILDNSMPIYSANLKNCDVDLSLNLPSVYPKPLLLRCYVMDFNEYSFVIYGDNETHANDDGTFCYKFSSVTHVNFTAYCCVRKNSYFLQFSDHPQGSYVQCSNVVYGSEVELFFHQPEGICQFFNCYIKF